MTRLHHALPEEHCCRISTHLTDAQRPKHKLATCKLMLNDFITNLLQPGPGYGTAHQEYVALVEGPARLEHRRLINRRTLQPARN